MQNVLESVYIRIYVHTYLVAYIYVIRYRKVVTLTL